MAIALVQSAEKIVTGTSSTTLAFPSDVAAGNLLAVCVSAFHSFGVTISTPSDTRSSSYAAMAAQQNPDFASGVRNYYALAPSSGACTVTVEINASGDYTCAIAEFSGVAAVSPLDTGTGGTGTGTAASAGNVTPSEDNCLIVAAMTHNGADRTLTEGAGWSLIQENEGGSSNMPLSAIYKVQTTATTEDADWTIGTGSVNWAATCGVFKAAAAATGHPAARRAGGVPHIGAHGAGLYSAVRRW